MGRDNVRSIEKFSQNAEIKRVFFKSIIGDMPGEWGAGWNKIGKTSGKPFISITLVDAKIGERKVYASTRLIKGSKDKSLAMVWIPEN